MRNARKQQRGLPLNGGRQKAEITKEQRTRLIGDFGARLALRLLGGQLLHSHDDRGDIVNHEERFWAEVKTAGKDRAGFDEHQLQNHLESGNDDYDRLCVIVKYKNYRYDPVSQQIVRAIAAATPTAKDLMKFLRKNVLGVYVLDSSIVEALKGRRKYRWRLRRGWGGKTTHIRVTWGLIRGLKEDPAFTFRSLKLDHRSFETVLTEREALLGGIPIRIPVLTVRKVRPEDREFDPVEIESEMPQPAYADAVPF